MKVRRLAVVSQWAAVVSQWAAIESRVAAMAVSGCIGVVMRRWQSEEETNDFDILDW